jgi:prepilin peptidase CpaA
VHPFSRWFLVAALVVAAVAAFYDLRTRRIPLWLTWPALAAAPMLHALAAYREHARGAFGLPGPALEGLLSLIGALACGIVPFAMERVGLMGGGDSKLLASVGALLTVRTGVEVQLVALLLAGYFGLARLAFQGRLLATLGRSLASIANPFLPNHRRAAPPSALFESLPFAPFVLLGVLVSVLLTARL